MILIDFRGLLLFLVCVEGLILRACKGAIYWQLGDLSVNRQVRIILVVGMIVDMLPKLRFQVYHS